MTIEKEMKLKEVIKSISRVDNQGGYVDEILKNDDFDLVEQLGFESLLFVELVVEIESAFGFEFDMNNLDTKKMKKYSELKNLVDDKLGK